MCLPKSIASKLPKSFFKVYKKFWKFTYQGPFYTSFTTTFQFFNKKIYGKRLEQVPFPPETKVQRKSAKMLQLKLIPKNSCV
jgi:hypothetical protein